MIVTGRVFEEGYGTATERRFTVEALELSSGQAQIVVTCSKSSSVNGTFSGLRLRGFRGRINIRHRA